MMTISAQIFDFAFNPYAMLSLMGIVVVLILVYLIQSRGIQNSANKWFTGFLMLLVLWGCGEFFGRLSANPTAAAFWGNISPPGWIFVGVFFLMFTLAYLDKESLLDSVNRKLLIFGSGVFWLFIVWNTNLVSSHGALHKVPWGWEGVPQTGPYFTFFLVWLESFFIASLVLLIRYYFKVKESNKKKQTLLLIIGLFIPLLGGTVTDAILPNLGYSVPGTAILLTSALGVLATYAILRYKLFVINPSTHFANIVKTMNEALIVLNMGEAVEFTNDTVSRLFSFKPEELKQARIQTLIKNETDLTLFENKFIGKLKQKEIVSNLELNLTAKDGSEIPVNISGAPLLDSGNNQVGYVMIASDMREMKKLVYNLVAERNKLSVTLSGITEGVFVVDKDGIISFFNEASEQIFGAKASAVIGKKADEVLQISDADGPVKVEYFFPKEKLSKDMVTYSRNGVRITQPDGKANFANLIAANIVEGEGINLGAIVTIHDVSKEKELEEMKLDFVSMAAHELRTPLTSIRGYLSVLQEELKTKLNEDQLSFLEKAFISSTQLAALVENLLSVSRIERGSLQIQTQVTDWERLLEESYTNFEPQAHERQVKFTYDKPKEKLPYVLVDKFRISEVVSNLIGNALNYTPSGGQVEVSTEIKEDQLITHVKDTGPGIPEQAIPKLFTKFFRVSGVLEQGSKGTGLGLYISKSIVDMHKGRIWVESKIGKGSTFSFSVPVSKDQTLPQMAIPQKGKRMFLRKSS
ncbi:MAG TPA: ATP-binding protein [Candidatus Saccharimonadales bacterium]|nr:ATP-binding protein [Candidatus Saccharimonadales bacterium]